MNLKFWITYENDGNKHVDSYRLKKPPRNYKTLGRYLRDILREGLYKLDNKMFWKIDRVKVTLKEGNTKIVFETEAPEALETMDTLLERFFDASLPRKYRVRVYTSPGGELAHEEVVEATSEEEAIEKVGWCCPEETIGYDVEEVSEE